MATSAHRNDTETRISHNPIGWHLPALSPDTQDCTTNHTGERNDGPPCTGVAVWKVVEFHDLSATLSFWCDTDLPADHRDAA